MKIDISIHAPAKVRHASRVYCKVPRRYFNPRTCEGATEKGIEPQQAAIISIHAPAKVRLI